MFLHVSVCSRCWSYCFLTLTSARHVTDSRQSRFVDRAAWTPCESCLLPLSKLSVSNWRRVDFFHRPVVNAFLGRARDVCKRLGFGPRKPKTSATCLCGLSLFWSLWRRHGVTMTFTPRRESRGDVGYIVIRRRVKFLLLKTRVLLFSVQFSFLRVYSVSVALAGVYYNSYWSAQFFILTAALTQYICGCAFYFVIHLYVITDQR